MKIGKESVAGHDQTITVAHDRSITVRNDQTLKVTRDRTVNSGRDDNLYVERDRKVTVKGSQQHSTTKDHISLVKGSHSLEVKGDLAQKVAGALGMDAQGDIVLQSGSKITLKMGSSFEKARQWILEGINKEILLNNEIPISNFKKTKENVYASVNSSDLEHNINIGEKFSKAPLTGENSQVVTLCHEMSHFDDILGTKDLGEGSPRSYAVSLARKCDERTMQSSYNFEMYFV
ncbi:bacteriophage T4 gp5 trimerization domain-containing protein [Buttiauxella agrestis]